MTIALVRIIAVQYFVANNSTVTLHIISSLDWFKGQFTASPYSYGIAIL